MRDCCRGDDSNIYHEHKDMIMVMLTDVAVTDGLKALNASSSDCSEEPKPFFCLSVTILSAFCITY